MCTTTLSYFGQYAYTAFSQKCTNDGCLSAVLAGQTFNDRLKV